MRSPTPPASIRLPGAASAPMSARTRGLFRLSRIDFGMMTRASSRSGLTVSGSGRNRADSRRWRRQTAPEALRDQRSSAWNGAYWVADAVPHLVFGAVTYATLRATDDK